MNMYRAAAFTDQTIRKLKSVMGNYESFVREPAGEVTGYEALTTREHFRNPPEGDWHPIEKGVSWGGVDQNLWVRGTYTVPPEMQGRKLYAVSHAGGIEELLFVNGTPAGLFSWKNRAVSAEHAARCIALQAEAGARIDICLECIDRLKSSGQNVFDASSPEDPNDPAEEDKPGSVFNGIEIVAINEELNTFVFDMRELIQINEYLPDEGFLRREARSILNRVAAELALVPQDTDYMPTVRACLKFTRPFFDKQGNALLGHVGIVGHSHLDTAWLWPVKETIRKCARTFSSVLALMREYPSFTFMQSSTLHAQWLKDYYPSVFEELRMRVAEGRYEINGGVYVECDCNITSGETMIRQFLYGQRFMQQNFGKTCDTFWLPDTFGYNAAIPQIMLGCGCRYFATNKLNCNEVNPPQHDSFIWKGIDGSKVLCHIPVSGGHTDACEVYNAAAGIRDKDASDMRLLAYGFGDGGGGPTSGMCEEAERVTRCAVLPETRATGVSAFFRELEKNADTLPVIDDELYFEFHRGTLTQNHEVKRKNRIAETEMLNAEYACVLSDGTLSGDYDKSVRNLLLNQFHDILPGTCISPVYEVYRNEMDANIALFRSETRRLLEAVCDRKVSCVAVFNTLSHARRDVIRLADADGYAAEYPCQKYTDIMGRNMTDIGSCEIPGFGSVNIAFMDKASVPGSVFDYDGTTLTTPFARVCFGSCGEITSFIDLRNGRELVRQGGIGLNRFLLAEDVPEKWDNWNIDSDAMDRLAPAGKLISRFVITDGMVEFRLRSEYALTERTGIVQDMVFYADSPRVDFHTMVNWNDKHKLLKAAFDLNLRAREAKCEIQFGHVSRPTHASTTYDAAKFEVCNHKWTDISEPGFGVALLNDCKYGISVGNCVLALSLHRGGTMPDGTGDRGVHEMTYALLPHNGGFCAESVILPAYELNRPQICLTGFAADTKPLLGIDKPNIICECVKPYEDGKSAYVLRLYECEGTRTGTKISLSNAAKAYYANMLEEPAEEAEILSGTIETEFSPFEIKTMIVFRSNENAFYS